MANRTRDTANLVSANNLYVDINTDKVGIGTTNPTSKLTVIGDVLVSGILTAARIVGTSLSISGISTIANFRMSPVGTGATVGGIGVTYYGDGSNLTGIVTSIVAGTNITISPSGTGQVTINSNSSGGGSISIANTTTSAIHYVGFGVTSTGTLTTLNVNTDRLQFVPSSGTLSATVFTSLSDRTQKEDIRPIENAIGIVNQLTGVRYNWKNNTNKPSIGLIAQDVEEVIPEVVVEMADGLKSVSYGNIVAVLIEAIKEQQVRIEELEDRLNA